MTLFNNILKHIKFHKQNNFITCWFINKSFQKLRNLKKFLLSVQNSLWGTQIKWKYSNYQYSNHL
jgi:hypothetical protein